MITFDHVSKTYSPGTKAVEDFSLTIAPHTTTVFLGTSGCGKTTLMRMVNRMVTPTSGTVIVRGRDVTHEDPVVLRRSIGYVLQDGGLFPHRTIVDNIATVPVLEGASQANARADALKLMELVGLDPSMAKRYPAQLSGGQRQRVGVARALANRADILLPMTLFASSSEPPQSASANESWKVQPAETKRRNPVRPRKTTRRGNERELALRLLGTHW